MVSCKNALFVLVLTIYISISKPLSSHFTVTVVLLSLDFIISTINSVHHHEESFVNIQKYKYFHFIYGNENNKTSRKSSCPLMAESVRKL